MNDSTALGDDALAQLFIHPVQCQTTYWQRMNEDAIEPRTRTIGKEFRLGLQPDSRSLLEQQRSRNNDPGWVVVPSDFDSGQVGLLYGILEYKRLTTTRIY